MKFNTSQLVASNSVLNLFCYVFKVAVSFLTMVLASRWLGAEKYGEFNLLLSYTVYLSYFLSLGFDSSLPYYFSKNLPADVTPISIFKSVIKIMSYFGVSILAIASLIIFWKFSNPDKEHLLLPMYVLTVQHFFYALGNVGAAYLRGHKVFGPWIFKEQIVGPLLQLVFLIVFVKFLQMGVAGYAIGYALAVFSGLLAVLYYLIPFIKQSMPADLQKTKSVPKKELIKFSAPLGFMSSLEPILVWTSIFLAGTLLTAKDAGFISVYTRLSTFVGFLFMAIQPVFAPFIADHLSRKQYKETKDVYQTVNYWSSKWALLLIFVLATSSHQLLLVFGQEFTLGELALYFVLPGYFIEATFGASKQSLIMGGVSWFNALSYLVAIIVNILVCYLLVDKYGLVGVSIALSCAFLVLNTLRVVRFYKVCKVMPLNKRHVSNLTFLFVLLVVLGGAIHLYFAAEWEKLLLALLIFFCGLVGSFWKDRHLFIGKILSKLQKN